MEMADLNAKELQGLPNAVIHKLHKAAALNRNQHSTNTNPGTAIVKISVIIIQ